jgi:hypothetical protein
MTATEQMAKIAGAVYADIDHQAFDPWIGSLRSRGQFVFAGGRFSDNVASVLACCGFALQAGADVLRLFSADEFELRKVGILMFESPISRRRK